MLHLYAALAEKERRLISERTRAALAAKKEPIGMVSIAKQLNERGIRTARGRAVARLVRRKSASASEQLRGKLMLRLS